MENVPEVVGSDNLKHFQKWEQKLSELGYTNHIKIINAKNYGIPQNRRRCFMVSILNGNFEFGGSIPLKYKLKDFLEEQVDEKYYLTEKMFKGMIKTKFNSYKLENRLQDVNSCVDTLTTSTGDRCPHLIEQPTIPIKNATKQGYLEAESGDGIDISGRMEYHRGTVQKGLCQTLTTGGNDVGVCVCDTKESDTFRPTLERRIHENYPVSKTLTTKDNSCCVMMKSNTRLRIRKLTPKECIRLMGFTDKDFECMKQADLSDSAIYHCAGDSIVVSCLMMIFSKLFNDDGTYIKQIKDYVETIKEK